MPSIAEFNPNDSLLDVLKTPTRSGMRRANHREFIPDVNTPSASSKCDADSAIFNIDSAERFVFFNRFNFFQFLSIFYFLIFLKI